MSDVKLWLVFDKPQGAEKRYVARRWVHRDEKLVPTSQEIQTDDIEELRLNFINLGYSIRPKGFGKILDIWVEPDETLDDMDRRKRAF